jgi:DNA-binding transcriptional ArsR family regulator
MVQYKTLDRTLSALSDPTRRGILDRLGRGPASISQLAGPLGMSLTGLKKHVRILEEAEFVTTEKVGRTRQCRLGPAQLEGIHKLGPQPLGELDAWLKSFHRAWEDRLDRLDEYLQELQDKENKED